MWRRLSIGNALIQRLEQDCQAKGITTITATFDHENQIMNALSKSHKGWSDGERLNAYTLKRRTAMEPILQKLETTMGHRSKQTEIRALCVRWQLPSSLISWRRHTQIVIFPYRQRLDH